MESLARRFLVEAAAHGPQRVVTDEGRVAADWLCEKGLGELVACQCSCLCPACGTDPRPTWFRVNDAGRAVVERLGQGADFTVLLGNGREDRPTTQEETCPSKSSN